MRPGATTRDRWIWMTSAVLLAATIALELVVPLGYAVWLAYFLAVGVTGAPAQRGRRSCWPLPPAGHRLNVAPASSNSAFSFVNRTIGGCAFLMIALIVSRAIQARRQARALWLQEAENAVAMSRGDLGPEQIAEAAATSLAAQLGAEVGAVYRLEGGRLQLTGGIALPAGTPASLALHEGWPGRSLVMNASATCTAMMPPCLNRPASAGCRCASASWRRSAAMARWSSSWVAPRWANA